ncbi:MAG: acetylxylan esterase [Lentisphaeria bacterium]
MQFRALSFLFVLSYIFPLSCNSQAEEVSAPKYTLVAFASRDSSLYKIGEDIIFLVSLNSAKPVQAIAGKELSYRIQGDGGLNQKGTVISALKPVEIRTSMSRAGFVLLTVELRDKQQILASVYAGAGVEPEKIRSGTNDPTDFDQFWKEQIVALRQRQPKILEEEITDGENSDNARIYNIRIEDGIVNATGVLALPKTILPDGHPLYVTFNGASGIGARANIHKLLTGNVITFNMNIHDTKNQISGREEVLAMRKLPAINSYQFVNADQRELYAPKIIFLRIIRVLDYLKTRPEWNQQDLVAAGPSFGGAQAVVAAALDPQVKLCLAGAPAMCDHLGARNQQKSGWPQLLSNSGLCKDPETAAKASENSAYFDIANFARRVSCETVFGVGFIDRSCAPTSVYAAYNNLATTNKRMIHATRGGHGGSSKPGELGAFEVDRDPALAKLLKLSLLKNGDFEFSSKRPIQDSTEASRVWQFRSERIPWAWYFNPNNPGQAELCQDDQAPSGQKFLRLSGENIFVGQSFEFIPTENAVQISLFARGSGELCLRLSGKTQHDKIHTLDSPERWSEIREILPIPELAKLFWMRISGNFDIDHLQLTPINIP